MSTGTRGLPDNRGAPVTCPMIVLEVPLRGGKVVALVRYPLDVTTVEIMTIIGCIDRQPARDEP